MVKSERSVFNTLGISLSYRPLLNALILSGVYALLVGFYIWWSSTSAATHARTVQDLLNSELTKGMIFTLVTGGFLFLGGFGLFERLHHHQRRTAAMQHQLMAEERNAIGLQLVKVLAHDMNNSLTVLMAATDQLEWETNGKGKLESFAHIKESTNELREMVEKLYRLDSNQRVRESGEIRINRVLHDVELMARTHPSVSGCSIRYRQHKRNTRVHGCSEVLHRMLFNLVLNAGEATGGQGKIEIRTREEAGTLMIEVHDDGPGIPEEKRAQVFEPFYTTKHEGMGLGMLSIKFCVEECEGTIALDDSPLGGACFRIRIPTSQISQDAAASQLSQA